MTTLAELRARVETVLADGSNLIWSTDDLDEAIRRALAEYSQAAPVRKVTTLPITATGREIDVSSITDITEIVEVLCPYYEDENHPPYRRPFRHWVDSNQLYIMGVYVPQAGDVMRIFYNSMHTLEDLDSATATTLPTRDITTIITGAAGYAAYSRAVDLAEQVSIDRETNQYLKLWASAKISAFEVLLCNAARRHAEAYTAPIVQMPMIDRHDNAWA